MAVLKKATLQKVKANKRETKIGEPMPVQFNPSTLKLTINNQVEGGRSNARQRRQQTGASSNVLSMELVFDTADEGTSAEPVSVRTKTAMVEEFVLPTLANKKPPPRLKFSWGGLIVTGIVESLDIDFDLFASDGTPLRARAKLSIKEQEPKYQFVESSANATTGTTPATQPRSAAPGEVDPGNMDVPANPDDERSAPALDGESPAEFASRMGLEPNAWRSLATNLADGLELQAGVEVGFNPNITLNAGVGLTAGINASVGVSLEASLGLSAEASLRAGVSPSASARADTKINDTEAGKVLSSVGGVEAAIDTVAIASTQASTSNTLNAFNSPPRVSSTSSVNRIVRTPLAQSGKRTATQRASTSTHARPARPDSRAISYGKGLPLQPVTRVSNDPKYVTVCAEAAREQGLVPPFRNDPTTAPWEALPIRVKERDHVDSLESEKKSNPCRLVSNDCGCDGA